MAPAAALNPEPARVVVIDDDPVIRSLVKLHLGSAGYDVVEAEDAVAGGHLVMRTPPDLIICDVHMPYMSGYEFVAALKSDPLTRDIPVVFLTVNNDVAAQAEKLGAASYLKKPVKAGPLVRAVDLYAERSPARPAH